MAEYFLRPQARRDATETAVHIAGDNPTAARRFLLALEGLCEQIATMPEMGKPYIVSKSLGEIRMLRMNRQYRNFLIFYKQTRTGVDIVRVLHGSRDYPLLFQ